ncbi:uncharacterized protein LOC128752671 [Synchiropus splendidus]|uniref:uncharacterized protein LOC128752671 n=1 Tax=Synchiropus splendidus TaxID=270530 RepID=UPI00237E24DA|nr:uncharacterized protein LOC128752671 [Synchiropus splendidus]
MDSDGEIHPVVRPRRRTRPPVRLLDFEVEYAGLPHSGQKGLTSSTTREDLSRTMPRYSDQAPYSGLSGHAAQPETPRRTPGHLQGSDWHSPDNPSPSYSSPEPYYSEMRAIQEENARLMHQQQVFQSGMRALDEARCEIKELLQLACSLKADIGQAASRAPSRIGREPRPVVVGCQTYSATDEDEEENWPDPPPWPSAETDLYDSIHNLQLDQRQHAGPIYYADNAAAYPPPPPPLVKPGQPDHSHASGPFPRRQPTFSQPRLTPSYPGRTRPTSTSAYQLPEVYATSPNPGRHVPEQVYRGPQPTIPKFLHPDPSEFARLRIALENLLPVDATELFKYQVLVDHLKFDEAKLIADAYLNSPTPYTHTMMALHDKFGQPHHLALRKIASVLEAPEVRRGDAAAFQRFSLQIQSLVGLLQTLGPEGEIELNCGSHVARLLSKLPPEQRADFRRHQGKQPRAGHTLYELSEWLRYESWCQGFDNQLGGRGSRDRSYAKSESPKKQTTTILHGAEEPPVPPIQPGKESPVKTQTKTKAYCAYCESKEHYFSQCSDVAKLSKDQLKEWIQANNRCWRCARQHQAAQCTLKKACNICQKKHLLALHEINTRATSGSMNTAVREEACLTSSTSDALYLDRHGTGNRVLLKVVPVLVQYGKRTLETFAILDDGSERTMLLPAAAKFLDMKGLPEDLPLRTVRQDIQVLHGHKVSFSVSPATNPENRYNIAGAFTASRLSLAQHSYPVDRLQRRFRHLRGLPIPALKGAQPSLLIGSDQPHLITPVEPVRLGPPGGPAAIHTRLGWTLQGPVRSTGRLTDETQCLFISSPSTGDQLFKHVKRLWEIDTVPYRNEKEATRSKQDKLAVAVLETKTARTKVDGISRYATPLLRHPNMPQLRAPTDSVMPLLRSTERRLRKNPIQAKAYKVEMQRLIDSGTVQEVAPETIPPKECWYIPHHLVSHNGKNRLVFNCSHQYLGQTLNQYLLPGPTLGASLLGVLLRFREYPVAVSGDIKGMFHQVRLLPEDRPLLRFLWRDLNGDEAPKVYEWQVLPFGTTCSPCCATYALQSHVAANSQPGDKLRFSVEKCFYVDNCLQSVRTPDEAKLLVDQLRELLAPAGFDLRQWACNNPDALSHLPHEARSESLDLWLVQDKSNPLESTLGLSWNWSTDTLSYKHRPVTYEIPTLRNIYRVLASQYDPLGLLLPFSTRAKLIIRQLWDQQRSWDDPNLPPELLQAWSNWEAELQSLPHLSFPRPYMPKDIQLEGATHEIHIFADASEQVYGAVAYLRTQSPSVGTCLSFIMARSRVAPKRIQSIPRLELCAALVGAKLAYLIEKELTLNLDRIVLWSDSTTVLTWLQSQSCRYKVFVGVRVAEIQELTEKCTWRYVESENNPADDLTRGKTLASLVEPNRWVCGPTFLLQSPEHWPEQPSLASAEEETELRKVTHCGLTATSPPLTGDKEHNTWQELIDATVQDMYQSE